MMPSSRHGTALVYMLLMLIRDSATRSGRSVLVTGSNRGMGLEWVKQLTELDDPPEFIFATCRQAANNTYMANLRTIADASNISKVIILQLDVTKLNEIQNAARDVSRMVGSNGLNVLINNAGIFHGTESFFTTTQEACVETFKINSIGPLIVAQQFAELLRMAASNSTIKGRMSIKRAAIINISSILGSIYIRDYPAYPYSMSKAALNMATGHMSNDLWRSEIMVIAFHPGYVKTRMTGFRGNFTPRQAVNAMMKTLGGFDERHSGGYYTNNGTRIPY